MEDILFGDYAVKIMNETLEKKAAESEKKNLELEFELRELKESAKAQIEQCNVRIAELEQLVRKLSKNN